MLTALKPEFPPEFTASYYPQAAKLKGQSEKDILVRERKRIIASVDAFAKANGYMVICDKGCDDIETELQWHGLTFWLGLKSPGVHTDYYLPNALEIIVGSNNRFRRPQQQTEGISDQPWNWLVQIKGPNPYTSTQTREGVEHNDLRMPLFGTGIARAFLKQLTKDVEQLSVIYRGQYNIHYHVTEAFDNGEMYALYPELTDFNLIKGKMD